MIMHVPDQHSFATQERKPRSIADSTTACSGLFAKLVQRAEGYAQ